MKPHVLWMIRAYSVFLWMLSGLMLSMAMSSPLHAKEHDFVIVGSGAGGGPMAAKLAEAGYSVLLLEAGFDDGLLPNYYIPVANGSASENNFLSWNFSVDHFQDVVQAMNDSKMMCESFFGDVERCEMQEQQCQCSGSHPFKKGIFYPRGSSLGGSTANNAMISVLAKNSDWQGIADLTGDSSWQPEAMMQYADRFEAELTQDQPKAEGLLAMHGETVEGIIKAIIQSESPVNLPTGATAVDALGIGLNQSIRDNDGKGVWLTPTAINRGQRKGAREMILRAACLKDVNAEFERTSEEIYHDCIAQGLINPDTGRPFLTVKTGALVTKVIFKADPVFNTSLDQWVCEGECKQAIGVEYIDRGHVYSADRLQLLPWIVSKKQVQVNNEVILSAGTFNTPQLLMLSGIGESDHLADKGVALRHNLPGVGQNLQDRYEVAVINETQDLFKVHEDCNVNSPLLDPCFAQYKQDRRETGRGTGFFSTNGFIFSYLSQSSVSPDVDLHIFAGPIDFRGYYNGYSGAEQAGDKWSWLILKGHTENRGGEIRLSSNSPLDKPDIRFNYFEEGNAKTVEQGGKANASELDLTAVVEGIKTVRRMNAQVVQNGLIFNEVQPGLDIQTDEQLKNWVRNESWGHHASGSARIGPDNDPLAVLDSRFRVRGIQGLRVVDASVFPRIPGTFIASAVYMISEKAADTLISDYPQ
ncbi:GMC family oxidoreductase [Shewanella surugensis]|uniref:GMC family oxidoreductase N-terminal domain-containing protein n=1 Tax=Shewanella surugensis TaxID=212020 RepID=A0ABT0LFV6_9GAMM|nr:GMC oxidoreductase [Shewanella surugensis]MCL1126545.1 GMC family oxidoreductase N-terminal domain-containing protein [Shewanella surugensis]